MEKIYVFKVALKYRKGLWRRIEIKGNQTLGDFDYVIRGAFNHDLGDHLSEFFSGQVWRSKGFGEIEPGGSGSGAGKKIAKLGISEGDKLRYVYDFGDDIRHVVTLEKIVEPEQGAKYPRVTSQNKPRYRYCEMCKNKGKKTIATWICLECSQERGRRVLLCEDCLMKEHEDHYADEILY
ncbi:MAG: hypothetical protein U9O41_05420 [Candidatus Aerophobetes bacterium]|nr:hypothetical protein [Candidatus Aerophobetes bacterium]